MSEQWDRGRYEREKRNFIETRRNLQPVYLQVSLIFTATWLVGWLMSWALLQRGVTSMPLRYAISFFVAYIVFVACVRIWADFMRRESGGRGSDVAGFDFPVVDGEGCLVVLAALALGLVGAGIFALVGGLPLLLEVAFEVAFAGVIVRRLSRKLTLGTGWGR